MNRKRDVEILECTLRDGSYAIDFKFTDADTKLITKKLSQVGFKWIEVGHGLGLGASAANKGKMPHTDEVLIRASKSVSEKALIGMFCIPDLAPLDLLGRAKENGLDFIRIGQNATEAEGAFPYLEEARKVGLIPFMNFMKSYAITPKEFGEKAKSAQEAGAEVVYLVDSSGGMLPENVDAYLKEARDQCECPLGFHGHDNLKIAVSNSIQAMKSGATYLDTTLCGLGRSSGNAASETSVAILEMMGKHTGIDLFELLDIGDMYMWPLMSGMQLHSMMAVAMGYGQFHSSFLPEVRLMAAKYRVDIKRLVIKMGQIDPVHLDKKKLEEVAIQLADTDKTVSRELISFRSKEVTGRKISTSIHSVQTLVDGMVVLGAKRPNTLSILELVPYSEETDDLVLPEFILEDSQCIIGRVTVGSFQALEQVLKLSEGNISLYLTDGKNIPWAEGWVKKVVEHAGKKNTIPFDTEELKSRYLVDAICLAAHNFGDKTLLMYGIDEFFLDQLKVKDVFDNIFIYGGRETQKQTDAKAVYLSNHEDWAALDIKADIVLLINSISENDFKQASRLVKTNGKIIAVDQASGFRFKNYSVNDLIFINPHLAYSGLVSRIIAMKSGYGR
ncbi:hypothetical protein ACFL5V_10475 [Fibrobacterota bacterium]